MISLLIACSGGWWEGSLIKRQLIVSFFFIFDSRVFNIIIQLISLSIFAIASHTYRVDDQYSCRITGGAVAPERNPTCCHMQKLKSHCIPGAHSASAPPFAQTIKHGNVILSLWIMEFCLFIF